MAMRAQFPSPKVWTGEPVSDREAPCSGQRSLDEERVEWTKERRGWLFLMSTEDSRAPARHFALLSRSHVYCCWD